MTIMQVWLVFGLPALLLGMSLFIGRSPWRAGLGYLVMAGGFAGLAFVDRASAAIFGGALALLLAAGRGGTGERVPELTEPQADVPGWVGSDRTLEPGKHP